MYKSMRSIGVHICRGLAGLLFMSIVYLGIGVPGAIGGAISGDEESYVPNPNAVVTHGRTLYDRIHREFFVLFEVTNSGSDPIYGPARLLIKDSTLNVLNAHGTTPDGVPYLNILSPEGQLAPGGVIGPIRVNFALQRVRLTYNSYVENAQPAIENDVWVCFSPDDLGCNFDGVTTIEFRNVATDTIYTLDVDPFEPDYYCTTIPRGTYWIDAFGESFWAFAWDPVTITDEYDPVCTPQNPSGWNWDALCNLAEYPMEACSFSGESECCVGPTEGTEYHPMLYIGVGIGDPNYDGLEDTVLYLFFSDCYSLFDQCGEVGGEQPW